MPQYYKTSQLAKLVGVHPNTVRLYEEKRFLSPVPRGKNGYRQYLSLHLEQMRLAHLALKWPYSGSHQIIIDLVRSAAEGNMGMTYKLAHTYLANVRKERAQAEAAVEVLERWAQGLVLDATEQPMNIGQAAEYLDVTADQLRNWDRSGLLDVPRDPETGYRVYGYTELGRLRVIRMLRQSGYSLMAILRMLRQFDQGCTEGLRSALDTPGENEALVTVADRWLTTLSEQEQRAEAIIRQLGRMTEMSL
jgi:DNA-binding transcriptional MerR regulator